MNLNIRSKNKKGYTLVELIVVIALMGIVLSVAIPSFKIILRTAEKKELMEFKRDLNFARNSSIMENQIYLVRIDKVKNQYFIERATGKNKEVIKNKEFVNGIILKENNLNNSITFYPSGSPSKAGTIELSNRKGEKIEITITPATGKINIKFNKRWGEPWKERVLL